jgi:hypothetical protein
MRLCYSVSLLKHRLIRHLNPTSRKSLNPLPQLPRRPQLALYKNLYLKAKQINTTRFILHSQPLSHLLQHNSRRLLQAPLPLSFPNHLHNPQIHYNPGILTNLHLALHLNHNSLQQRLNPHHLTHNHTKVLQNQQRRRHRQFLNHPHHLLL